MPQRPLRPCNKPGCASLIREGRYCVAHGSIELERKREKWQRFDDTRGTATERGYDTRWRKARVGWLKHHPLCAECERHGETTAATVVDHIIPHRGDRKLFWDRNNWQSLCKACHDKKTGRGE